MLETNVSAVTLPDADPIEPVASARSALAPGPDAPGPISRRYRFGWIPEVTVIAVVGYVYETIRNAVMGSAVDALRNAKTLTRIETWLGIYHEHAVQHLFLNWPAIVAFWNFYYDTAHFLVPAFAAIYLYVKFPARYVRWRNVFFFLLLGVGQLVWLAFPITPPKYMPKSYGFHDTQVEYWNVGPQKGIAYGADGEPKKSVVDAVGNLYGGLPSHHASWALWSVCALWPITRRRWAKGLLITHLVLTVGAITVTGNHRWIDIAGSCVELAVAFCLALLLERVLARRRARRASRAALVPAA